jgi:hypothetical protein
MLPLWFLIKPLGYSCDTIEVWSKLFFRKQPGSPQLCLFRSLCKFLYLEGRFNLKVGISICSLYSSYLKLTKLNEKRPFKFLNDLVSTFILLTIFFPFRKTVSKYSYIFFISSNTFRFLSIYYILSINFYTISIHNSIYHISSLIKGHLTLESK